MEDDLLYLYNQNLANEATDLFDQRQRDLVNQAAMNVFQTGFNNRNQGIMSTEQAQPFEFLKSAYEDQDEDAEQVDYLPGQNRDPLSGIMKVLRSIPTPTNLLLNMLPEQDPRATGIRNFYGSQFGLTPTGQVASGIMKGYNPVSGGFLNKITGGRFGQPTQYGLAPAIRRRIDRIANRKIAQTDISRARIKELQDLARADTTSRARQAAPNVYRDAGDRGTLGPGGGFSTSGREGAFSSKSGRGRQDF